MNAASSPKLFNTFIPSNVTANAKSPAMGLINTVRNATTNVGRTIGNAFAGATSVAANAVNSTGSVVGNMANNVAGGGFPWLMVIVLALLATSIGLITYFYNDIKDALPTSVKDMFGIKSEVVLPPPPPPPPAPEPEPAPTNDVLIAPPTNVQAPPAMIESLLPKKKEVFNVSSNKYMYADAEPLCRALGAELATYDQVKAAFDGGADWCNYGWTKGQLALYPTQKSTYDKMQAGPEGQRMACGRPGLNGGHFDNPELRFGVNCFGPKPAQSQHDASAKAKGYPISPDAMDFDRKVNQFKSEADNTDILPFHEGNWSE
jgi:hypothetical protein